MGQAHFSLIFSDIGDIVIHTSIDIAHKLHIHICLQLLRKDVGVCRYAIGFPLVFTRSGCMMFAFSALSLHPSFVNILLIPRQFSLFPESQQKHLWCTSPHKILCSCSISYNSSWSNGPWVIETAWFLVFSPDADWVCLCNSVTRFLRPESSTGSREELTYRSMNALSSCSSWFGCHLPTMLCVDGRSTLLPFNPKHMMLHFAKWVAVTQDTILKQALQPVVKMPGSHHRVWS